MFTILFKSPNTDASELVKKQEEDLQGLAGCISFLSHERVFSFHENLHTHSPSLLPFYLFYPPDNLALSPPSPNFSFLSFLMSDISLGKVKLGGSQFSFVVTTKPQQVGWVLYISSVGLYLISPVPQEKDMKLDWGTFPDMFCPLSPSPLMALLNEFKAWNLEALAVFVWLRTFAEYSVGILFIVIGIVSD